MELGKDPHTGRKIRITPQEYTKDGVIVWVEYEKKGKAKKLKKTPRRSPRKKAIRQQKSQKNDGQEDKNDTDQNDDQKDNDADQNDDQKDKHDADQNDFQNVTETRLTLAQVQEKSSDYRSDDKTL